MKTAACDQHSLNLNWIQTKMEFCIKDSDKVDRGEETGGQKGSSSRRSRSLSGSWNSFVVVTLCYSVF